MTDPSDTPPVQQGELLPCPFCDSGDGGFVERADFSSAYVMCNDCGARGPTSCDETEEDADASESGECEPGERAARRLWNNRPTASPADEARAREVLAQAFEADGNHHAANCIREAHAKSVAREAYAVPLHFETIIRAIKAAFAQQSAPPATGGEGDLAQRCGEILSWRRTGLYEGDALQALAKKSPFVENGSEPSPMRWAEQRTVDEALERCASLPPSSGAAQQDAGARLSSTPTHVAERRQCSVCKAIVASYPEGMCCHCHELPWPIEQTEQPATPVKEPEDQHPEIAGDPLCKIESYNQMHQTAVELGYPSILEALEALAERRAGPTLPTREEIEQLVLRHIESGHRHSQWTVGSVEWRGRLADDLIALLSQPRGEAATLLSASGGGDLLAWFSEQRSLVLYHYSPVYGDDNDQSVEWRVDRESGSINDREFETIGRGETALIAIQVARTALDSSMNEKGEG